MSTSSRGTGDDTSLKRFSKGFYLIVKDRQIDISLGTSKKKKKEKSLSANL